MERPTCYRCGADVRQCDCRVGALRHLYAAVLNQVNCCIIGCGCGLAIVVSGGALTGAAGYGAVRVLA